MKSKFEQWFQQQPFYLNLRFIHGDQLFISENSVYQVLAVQIAWLAWQEQQKRIDELESKVTDLSKNLKDRESAVLVRQEKIEEALQELMGAIRFVAAEDIGNDPDYIKGAVLRGYARLQKKLKGGDE